MRGWLRGYRLPNMLLCAIARGQIHHDLFFTCRLLNLAYFQALDQSPAAGPPDAIPQTIIAPQRVSRSHFCASPPKLVRGNRLLARCSRTRSLNAFLRRPVFCKSFVLRAVRTLAVTSMC